MGSLVKDFSGNTIVSGNSMDLTVAFLRAPAIGKTGRSARSDVRQAPQLPFANVFSQGLKIA
jgi:hypothetical protein